MDAPLLSSCNEKKIMVQTPILFQTLRANFWFWVYESGNRGYLENVRMMCIQNADHQIFFDFVDRNHSYDPEATLIPRRVPISHSLTPPI